MHHVKKSSVVLHTLHWKNVMKRKFARKYKLNRTCISRLSRQLLNIEIKKRQSLELLTDKNVKFEDDNFIKSVNSSIMPNLSQSGDEKTRSFERSKQSSDLFDPEIDDDDDFVGFLEDNERPIASSPVSISATRISPLVSSKSTTYNSRTSVSNSSLLGTQTSNETSTVNARRKSSIACVTTSFPKTANCSSSIATDSHKVDKSNKSTSFQGSFAEFLKNLSENKKTMLLDNNSNRKLFFTNDSLKTDDSLTTSQVTLVNEDADLTNQSLTSTVQIDRNNAELNSSLRLGSKKIDGKMTPCEEVLTCSTDSNSNISLKNHSDCEVIADDNTSSTVSVGDDERLELSVDPLDFLSCSLSQSDVNSSLQEDEENIPFVPSQQYQLNCNTKVHLTRLRLKDLTPQFWLKNGLSNRNALYIRKHLKGMEMKNKNVSNHIPVPYARQTTTIPKPSRIEEIDISSDEQTVSHVDPFTHSLFAPIITGDSKPKTVLAKNAYNHSNHLQNWRPQSTSSYRPQIIPNLISPVTPNAVTLPAVPILQNALTNVPLTRCMYLVNYTGTSESTQQNLTTPPLYLSSNLNTQDLVIPSNSLVTNVAAGNAIIRPSVILTSPAHMQVIPPLLPQSNQALAHPKIMPKSTASLTSKNEIGNSLTAAYKNSSSINCEFRKHPFYQWVREVCMTMEKCSMEHNKSGVDRLLDNISFYITSISWNDSSNNVQFIRNLIYQMILPYSCCSKHALQTLSQQKCRSLVSFHSTEIVNFQENWVELPIPVLPITINQLPTSLPSTEELPDIFALKRIVFVIDRRSGNVLFPLPALYQLNEDSCLAKITVVVVLSLKHGLGPGLIVFPHSVLGLKLRNSFESSVFNDWVIACHLKGGITHSMMTEFFNGGVKSWLRRIGAENHHQNVGKATFRFDWWWKPKDISNYFDIFNIFVQKPGSRDPFDICINCALMRLWGFLIKKYKFTMQKANLKEHRFPSFIYNILENLTETTRLLSWCNFAGLCPENEAKKQVFLKVTENYTF